MSLYLTPINIGEVTVIDAAGRITLGENTKSFRKMIHELTAGGRKQIVLNLTDVTYIDSSGIGELIAAYAQLGPRDQVALPPTAQQRFELLCTTSARPAAASPMAEWNALRC